MIAMNTAVCAVPGTPSSDALLLALRELDDDTWQALLPELRSIAAAIQSGYRDAAWVDDAFGELAEQAHARWLTEYADRVACSGERRSLVGYLSYRLTAHLAELREARERRRGLMDGSAGEPTPHVPPEHTADPVLSAASGRTRTALLLQRAGFTPLEAADLVASEPFVAPAGSWVGLGLFASGLAAALLAVMAFVAMPALANGALEPVLPFFATPARGLRGLEPVAPVVRGLWRDMTQVERNALLLWARRPIATCHSRFTPGAYVGIDVWVRGSGGGGDRVLVAGGPDPLNECIRRAFSDASIATNVDGPLVLVIDPSGLTQLGGHGGLPVGAEESRFCELFGRRRVSSAGRLTCR